MRRRCLTAVLILLIGAQAPAQLSTTALLDTIQHTAFNFFWLEANPSNGLIKDRANYNGGGGAPSSIASVGFGLSAVCIGADHGWVTRQAAADRVLTTLNFFWRAAQGAGNAYSGMYGLFYHFLEMTTGQRAWDSELSTIDTALLLAGIIDARQYFTGSDPAETQIRQLADSIYYRMNWDQMRNYHYGILMGWNPGTGFAYKDSRGNVIPYSEWKGYNEASIMYIMALGSPTYPVGPEAWGVWTSTYQFQNQWGFQYVVFPPLFGHQYTQVWVDLRGVRDQYMKQRGTDYFENSVRATYANRAYCMANPGGWSGYGELAGWLWQKKPC